MSPAVLQLFPKPLAHVAGLPTPLHNEVERKKLNSKFKTRNSIMVGKKKSNGYHSQMEKKIFLPEFRSALLMVLYLDLSQGRFQSLEI
jgi:hypothetical protein